MRIASFRASTFFRPCTRVGPDHRKGSAQSVVSPTVDRVLHLGLTLELPSTRAGFAAPVDRWPSHATVMQSFQIDAGIDEVIAAVRAVAETVQPLTAVGGHFEGFGPDRDIRVTVLNGAGRIVALHHELLAALQALPGFAPDVPEWAGAGFRPHVTAGVWGELDPGESISFDRIAIIDLGTADERLQVAAVALLGGQSR